MTMQRTYAIGVGVTVVVLVLGAMLTRCGSASTDTAEETSADHPTGTAVISRVEVEPSEPDEAGAVAAAVAYTQATQRWLYLTDEEITAEVAEVATPAAVESLTDEVVAQVSDARVGLGTSEGPVWWIVRPLATKASLHDSDWARVSVWTVTVLSAAGVAVPQSEWTTIELDLQWHETRWLIDAVRDVPGPTPVPAPGDDPWDAGELDEALDGFARLDGEPIP